MRRLMTIVGDASRCQAAMQSFYNPHRPGRLMRNLILAALTIMGKIMGLRMPTVKLNEGCTPSATHCSTMPDHRQTSTSKDSWQLVGILGSSVVTRMLFKDCARAAPGGQVP